MNVMRVPRYKLVIMFLIIYCSSNSFVLSVKYSSWANQIMIAVFLLTTVVSLVKGKNYILKNSILLMIIAILFLMCNMFLYGYAGGYILLVINFALIILVMHLFSKEEFIECFVLIMCFLSVFAIFSGVVSVFVPNVLGVFTQYKLDYTDVYADLIFSFQNTLIIRINSIWGEAGMYAVFLNFALFFETFNDYKQPSYWRLVILSVALLMTFSTNGLVCYMIYVIALATNRGKFQKRLLWGMLTIALIAVVMVNSSEAFQTQLIASSVKLSSDDISFIGRLAPIIYNIQEGLKNPIFGQGVTSGKFYVNYSFYQGYMACDTSTTTALFKNFGLYISLLSVFLSYRIAKDQTNTAIAKWVSFVFLILNVNTQNLIYDQIYWLILFVPFMYSAREENERDGICSEEE